MVNVDDEAGVFSSRVHGRVQNEAGDVDAEVSGAAVHQVALEVDFDQRRRGDLVIQQSERIEQEVIFVSGNADGNVVEDGLSPSEVVHQSVQGGQLAAQLLLSSHITGWHDIADVIDGDDGSWN